jgi:LPS sulfotransferase NodH
MTTPLTEQEVNDAAFDRPAAVPQTRLLICSTPRTGSYLLCRAMIHNGIGVPHEYFNGINAGVISERLGPRKIDSRDLAQDGAERRAYIHNLLARRTVKDVFAAKIQRGQFRQYFERNYESVPLFAGAGYIYLYREDLLAQAVSLHVSLVTGQWGVDERVATRPAEDQEFFDAGRIRRCMDELTTQDSEWRKFFAINAIKPFFLSYEELRRDQAGTLRRIVAHFNLGLAIDDVTFGEEPPNALANASPKKSEIARRFREEERFTRLLAAADRMREEGRSVEEVLAAYARASETSRDRLDALHAASRLCRETGKFADGYALAQRGFSLAQKGAVPGTPRWIVDYGLLDELAVNAYWIGKYRECLEACRQLLNDGRMPQDMVARVSRNAELAAAKLR